jgi:hypothetical protein
LNPPPLFLVFGAFGSGKATLAPLVAIRLPECFVLDVDWLLDPLSRLAKRRLDVDSASWPALGEVWLEIVRAPALAGRSAVLFAPSTPAEIDALTSRQVVGAVHALLLDCSGETLQARLEARGEWVDAWTQEALVDAVKYRALGFEAVETHLESAEETADRIVRWVEVVS